jgi:hypothetical protein
MPNYVHRMHCTAAPSDTPRRVYEDQTPANVRRLRGSFRRCNPGINYVSLEPKLE